MRQMTDAFESIRCIAASLSPALRSELDRIGLIEVPPPQHRTVAEHLFVAIINQQFSGRAADAIWRRIVAAAEARGCLTADLFGRECEHEVRACGVSRNKIRALQAVRDAEARGLLHKDRLSALPHEARAEQLCQIWGIGRWTADMVGISHFMDPDIWPAGEVSATGTLRRLLGCTDTVKAAAAFAPYRSLLARYMWRIKDTS
jgi:DNA-3-methyladenine glycosylase II